MHGVIDRLDDVQHSGQSLLELSCPVSFAALEHFLKIDRREGVRVRKRERENGELRMENGSKHAEEIATHGCFFHCPSDKYEEIKHKIGDGF